MVPSSGAGQSRAAMRWQRIKITQLELDQIRLTYARREITPATRLEAVA